MNEWRFIPGDPWVICDRCGFKVRLSGTRKEWTGLRVCATEWEARHPQDLVKTKPDRQSFPGAKPRPVDRFLAYGEVTAENL